MPTDTIAHLGRAVLGTTPTEIVAAVPSGQAWIVATGYICNKTSSTVRVTLWHLLTGDSTSTPPDVALILSGVVIRPNQTWAWGRGLYLPVGSSLYGQANITSSLIVNQAGVKRTL